MLIPALLNPIRTPLRIALFASSIGMLFIVPGKLRWTVAANFGALITLLFCLQLLNPTNNSFVAAVAGIGLNFAILSPVFWCSKLKLNAENLRFLFVMLWAFNAISSGFGILEMYYPGTFGRESKISTDLNGEFAEGLKVTLADGTSVYRPMGLTDSPGGAAGSGYTVILLATGLLLQKIGPAFRVILLISIVAGLFCIYLSQIRSLLVLTAICELVVFGTLVLRGQLFRVSGLIITLPFLFAAATAWAFLIGGEQVSKRVSSLGEASAGTVYYANRGTFLEDTIYRVLPEYPFGAGLGRWGMVYQYFGDKSSASLPSLWAEIQPTAWLYDGGAPLLLAYYAAIVACILLTLRVALYKSGVIADFATIVFALNIATLANTFSYSPFIGQSGLTFWLVNACFFAAEMRGSTSTHRRLKKTTNGSGTLVARRSAS